MGRSGGGDGGVLASPFFRDAEDEVNCKASGLGYEGHVEKIQLTSYAVEDEATVETGSEETSLMRDSLSLSHLQLLSSSSSAAPAQGESVNMNTLQNTNTLQNIKTL